MWNIANPYPKLSFNRVAEFFNAQYRIINLDH